MYRVSSIVLWLSDIYYMLPECKYCCYSFYFLLPLSSCTYVVGMQLLLATRIERCVRVSTVGGLLGFLERERERERYLFSKSRYRTNWLGFPFLVVLWNVLLFGALGFFPSFRPSVRARISFQRCLGAWLPVAEFGLLSLLYGKSHQDVERERQGWNRSIKVGH